MTNKFVIVGKVQVISKDNPDYPGFYIKPVGEETLIPISLHRDEDADQILKAQINLLQNNNLVGVSGKIGMGNLNSSKVKLYADRITIITK